MKQERLIVTYITTKRVYDRPVKGHTTKKISLAEYQNMEKGEKVKVFAGKA